MLDLIARLKSDETKTILLVEHKMDVVRSLADRIIVLHNGAARRRRRPGDGDRLADRAGGLSRHRAGERRHERAALRSRACTPTSAAITSSRASTSTLRAARRRCCSAVMAPARPRRCARSWGYGAPRRGGSRSGTRRSRACAASDVARLGVGYAPETMAVFSDLSVKENLVLGAREGPLDDARLHLDLRFLPGAQEILAVPRGVAVGRAEADAVDRPRHCRATRTFIDRRADQGPRPGDRRFADRLPQGDQGDRGHDPAGRTEFSRRSRSRRRGAGDGQRPHRP